MARDGEPQKIIPCQMADVSLDGAKQGKAPPGFGQTLRFPKLAIAAPHGASPGPLGMRWLIWNAELRRNTEAEMLASRQARAVRRAGIRECFGLPCPGRRWAAQRFCAAPGMARDGETQNKTSFFGRPMTREGCEAMESDAPAALSALCVKKCRAWRGTARWFSRGGAETSKPQRV